MTDVPSATGAATGSPPGARRIDAHHHLWDLSVRDQPWTAGLAPLCRSFGFDELARSLAEHGIDATVVVQTVPVFAETRELLALAATQPRIAGVVGWVDLTAADVRGQIADLRAAPGGEHLVAIRHQAQDEPDPRWLCRKDVRHGIAAVAGAGLGYDLLVRPPQLAAAVQTARELPGVRFILDHAGKPDIAGGALDPWRDHITALGRLDNVAVKLSGLVTEADHDRWTVDDLRPFVDVVLEVFGPERVMFGSDWPVCLLAADYLAVVRAAQQLTRDLTPEEQAAVFGGAATTWYRL